MYKISIINSSVSDVNGIYSIDKSISIPGADPDTKIFGKLNKYYVYKKCGKWYLGGRYTEHYNLNITDDDIACGNINLKKSQFINPLGISIGYIDDYNINTNHVYKKEISHYIDSIAHKIAISFHVGNIKIFKKL